MGLRGGEYLIRLFGPTVTADVAKKAVEKIIERWGTRRNEWKRDNKEYGGYSSTHGWDEFCGETPDSPLCQ